MQYKLVLSKHPEIILGTRKQNPMITDNVELTEEEINILQESDADLDILIHAQMMMEFQQDLKFKDPAYQLGVLAELFHKIGNSRMEKACMQAEIKKIDKYTSTPKFGEMLMKHTKLLKEE